MQGFKSSYFSLYRYATKATIISIKATTNHDNTLYFFNQVKENEESLL